MPALLQLEQIQVEGQLESQGEIRLDTGYDGRISSQIPVLDIRKAGQVPDVQHALFKCSPETLATVLWNANNNIHIY